MSNKIQTDKRRFTVDQASNTEIIDLLGCNDFYNNPLILKYKNNKFILGMGTADKYMFFKFKGQKNTFIYSYNKNLNYASFQIIDIENNNNEIESYFIDLSQVQSNNLLKKDFFDYAYINQFKILLNWFNY